MRLNSEGTGTGPYIVTEADPATGRHLERYEDYWGGWEGDHFDRVIVRVVEEPATMRQLVEAGEVDIMDRFNVRFEDVEALHKTPTLVVDIQDSTEVEYWAMAVAGPLATPEARKAMVLAFPYQDVIDGVYLGLATQTPTVVAPPVRGFAEDGSCYDDRSRAGAGVAGPGRGRRGDRADGDAQHGRRPRRLAQLFQANLAEIGITLTIEQVDSPTFTGIFYGDAPAEERPNFMRWGWWPDYNDAWNDLYPTTQLRRLGQQGGQRRLLLQRGGR